jgi:hypothetical protein
MTGSKRTSMNSKRWWEPLTYAAMSIFLVWHSCAIIVTPAPTSDIRMLVQRLQQPYLTLFRLDNAWSFFAPEVPSGTILRYVVEDPDGNRHPFDPASELSRRSPAYVWFTSWFDEVVNRPEVFGDAAAKFFCRRHASLRPVSVTLLSYEQNRFLPKDHLAGRHPLHPDFLTETKVKQVACPDR